MHDVSWGWPVMVLGFAIVAFMMFGWLGTVVAESVGGFYNPQVDRSFRWGMSWFIFSEVMFFAAFFGALLYARVLSVPWLGGADNNIFTPELWEGFKATWPLISTPGDVGQNGVSFSTNFKLVDTWGLPAVNTGLLLTSGVTLTFAHHALRAGHRSALMAWMLATIALGVIFLGFQITEYGHAYHDGLKLTSGIYGSTFYMLTGFHGFHVFSGVIINILILLGVLAGTYHKRGHYEMVEKTGLYWNFVDLVWVFVFTFFYLL